MKNRALGWMLMLSGVAAGFAASDAQARVSILGSMNQLSGTANTGFEKSALTFGMEVTEAVAPYFEPGVFLEMTKAATTADKFGGILFLGAQIRFNVPKILGFFVEGRIGATQGLAAADSSLAPGFGAATGFRFKIGKKLMIGPRVGIRQLTAETGADPAPTRSSVDYGLILTFGTPLKK